MATYQCINLDGMSRTDLSEIANSNRPEYHAKQRAYARLKCRAMGMRLDGRISDATLVESDCERIYESMPASLRW